jgi:hypothetical protein
MKIILGLFTTILFTGFPLAQSLQIEQEFSTSYYEFHDLKINFTQAEFNISKDKGIIFSEKLAGKKIFKSSPAENYFIIVNYQFSNEKTDYQIDVRVFDKNGELALPYKFQAYFDLPHSLVNINDNGVLALFDPLSFKVKLISKEYSREIELEKNPPFEMEKASYMEMNEDFLYVLTSELALDITENASNVKLYKIGLFDLNVDRKEIDYNTPTLIKLIGDRVFVSGVKFKDLKPIGKTIMYDLQLNELSSNDKIIEKLVSNDKTLYAKYFNIIYEMKTDLTVSNSKILPKEERICDIAAWKNNLVVITETSGERKMYSFLPNLNMDLSSRLNILPSNRVDNVVVYGDDLIIHYDSRSTKIKLTVK